MMAVSLTTKCRSCLGQGQQADTMLATAGLSRGCRAPGGGSCSRASGISLGIAPPQECHWLPGPQELDQGEGRILKASTLPALSLKGLGGLLLLPALGPVRRSSQRVW